MSVLVRDTAAMIAAMRPELAEGEWVFVTVADTADAAPLIADAAAMVREAEGVSLVPPEERAAAIGFDTGLPMRRITLMVASALDATGLTDAVAGALAAKGIACNMVAGHHHDHLFVPARDAGRALAILRALSAG